MKSATPSLQLIYQLNIQMQGFLRKWSELDVSANKKSDIFINYSNIKFLQRLNQNLLLQHSDSVLLEQLIENCKFIAELSSEISQEATASFIQLKEHTPNQLPAKSDHLTTVFAQFK
jgi:hypothetical protein